MVPHLKDTLAKVHLSNKTILWQQVLTLRLILHLTKGHLYNMDSIHYLVEGVSLLEGECILIIFYDILSICTCTVKTHFLLNHVNINMINKTFKKNSQWFVIIPKLWPSSKFYTSAAMYMMYM